MDSTGCLDTVGGVSLFTGLDQWSPVNTDTPVGRQRNSFAMACRVCVFYKHSK